MLDFNIFQVPNYKFSVRTRFRQNTHILHAVLFFRVDELNTLSHDLLRDVWLLCAVTLLANRFLLFAAKNVEKFQEKKTNGWEAKNSTQKNFFFRLRDAKNNMTRMRKMMKCTLYFKSNQNISFLCHEEI